MGRASGSLVAGVLAVGLAFGIGQPGMGVQTAPSAKSAAKPLAKPKTGKVVLTVGSKSLKVRVKGPVKRSLRKGVNTLPVGKYRVKVTNKGKPAKKAALRGVPRKLQVRPGRTSALTVNVGTRYLKRANPYKVALKPGAATTGPDGTKIGVPGVVVDVPKQADAIEFSASPVSSVKGLRGVKKVVGVSLTWSGQVSAPVTLRFSVPKKQVAVFGAETNGSDTHLMPARTTLKIDRPGVYFAVRKGARTAAATADFTRHMPKGIPAKIEHIVGSKTLALTSSRVKAKAASATLAGVEEALAQLDAEVDFVKEYVIPQMPLLETNCAALKLALPPILALERNRELLGLEAAGLLKAVTEDGRLIRGMENCVRELAEPCVKPEHINEVLALSRQMQLLGLESAYVGSVVTGILTGDKLCGGKLVGEIVGKREYDKSLPFDGTSGYHYRHDSTYRLRLEFTFDGVEPGGAFKGLRMTDRRMAVDYYQNHRTLGNVCDGYDMTQLDTAQFEQPDPFVKIAGEYTAPGLAGLVETGTLANLDFTVYGLRPVTYRSYGWQTGGGGYACKYTDTSYTRDNSIWPTFFAQGRWNANLTGIEVIDADDDPETTISGTLLIEDE